MSTQVLAGNREMPQTIYSEHVRTSQYVEVRDGTRLAIDIYRPVVDGRPVAAPLPVILTASLAARAQLQDDSYLLGVLRHGYAIASLETRGEGASFGRRSPTRIEAAADYWDLYDVIEWLAKRPWSSGKIGMAGCSNQGMTQYRAASVMPPHLKAIAPTSAPVDWAAIGSVNGVSTSLFAGYGANGEALPVDEDRDGRLRAAASMEHRITANPRIVRPFRDDPVSLSGLHVLPTYWWNFLPNFSVSKIPVFQYAGWRDFFSEQSFALYQSLARHGVRQKLIIGPWYHCEWHQNSLTDAALETVRWYDYWLKDIENELMDEAPIRYYVVGAPPGQEWKTADRWPLPTEKQTYFLGSQRTLQLRRPKAAEIPDRYTVNYTHTAANLATRWNPKVWREQKMPRLLPIETSGVDAASLTFTSRPLARDSELTGFPVVTLWVSSTAKDQDFFIYLEEVDPNGASTLLTEGAMRASNRATRNPPFDNGGLPWHPGYKKDQQDLQPGIPTKLEWALFPFSNYIKKGHRLRIAISSFERGSWDTPEVLPAPTVSIYHDPEHPSSITLPFISK